MVWVSDSVEMSLFYGYFSPDENVVENMVITAEEIDV